MSETATQSIEEELGEVEREIESMERELAQREQPIVWGEVDAEELEAKERRRAILPRLLTAARIKRAGLRIKQTERELELLFAVRDEAHGKLEQATAKRWKAIEEENAARQAWTDARARIEKRERRLKDLDRQIAELREG